MFVILYRDKQFDPEGQSEAFRNRVHLQDVENGDVSLILKNVMTDDTGTYECRFLYTQNNPKNVFNPSSNVNSDPISIVYLTVKEGLQQGEKSIK